MGGDAACVVASLRALCMGDNYFECETILTVLDYIGGYCLIEGKAVVRNLGRCYGRSRVGI